METVRFEIPNVPGVLRAVAAVLVDMAGGEDRQPELPFPQADPAVVEEVAAPPETNPFNAGTSFVPPVETDAPETPPAPEGVELDVDGLPWDSRINTSNKSQLKRGAWKVKRGTDPELVTTVHAELRAAMAVTPVDVPVPAEWTAPAEPLYGTPPPPAPPAPPAPEAVKPMVLADLILKITGDKDISQVRVAMELTALQVPSLQVLGSTRPDLIPALAAKLWPEEYA